MHFAKAMTLYALATTLIAWSPTAPATAEEALGVPLDCVPGETCFFQQYADMDPGPGTLDPFCGKATYNAHQGSDIRIRAMPDVARNVAVLALRAGTVLRTRDGEEDGPVVKKSDWPKFKGKDCGNGAIIDHGNGLEAQYCHMRKGSLRVKPGDNVTKGEPIGTVSASGMAAFPHLHVTVRKEGQAVDPFTGRLVGSGCSKDDDGEPVWSAEALDFLDRATVSTMAIGIAGSPPDYDRLVMDGAPPALALGDDAIVGWGWFLNLHKGDRMRFRMTAPDGDPFLDQTTEPLARTKAVYMQFAGRRRSPTPGTWRLTVDLMRDGKPIETKIKSVDVGTKRISRSE